MLSLVEARVPTFTTQEDVCYFNIEVTANPVDPPEFKHTILQVTIHFPKPANQCKVTKWTVSRRFSHFYQFHKQLVASGLAIPEGVSKPAKQPKAFVTHDDALYEERRAFFEKYLQLLIADKTIAASPIFVNFLSNGRTNVVEIDPPIAETKEPPVEKKEEEELLLAQSVPANWVVQIGKFELVIVHKTSSLGVELVKGAVAGWFRFEDAGEQCICYNDGRTKAQNWDTKFSDPSCLNASNLVPGGFAGFRITVTDDGFDIRSKGEQYLASLRSSSLKFFPDSTQPNEFKTLATSRMRQLAERVIDKVVAVPELRAVVKQVEASDRLAELREMATTSSAETVTDDQVVPLMKQYEPLTARLDLISANSQQLQKLREEDFDLSVESEQKDLLATLTQVLNESQRAGEDIEAALEHKHSPDGEWAPQDRPQMALFRVFRRRFERETEKFDLALGALAAHLRSEIRGASEVELSPEEVQKMFEAQGFGVLKSPFKPKEAQTEAPEMDEHIENLVLRQARHFTEEMEGTLSMRVNKQWRERYCTLVADVRRRTEQRYCLRFFENKRQSSDVRLALGHVMLGLASTVETLQDKPFAFELVENPSLDTEKFAFHADSERNLKRWLDVLAAVTNSNWQATASIPCDTAPAAQHWKVES